MIGPLPPLAGKTALVTGGSSGIGLAIAGGLASAGAHVVIAARNSQRNDQAIRALRSDVPNASVEAAFLDLSDFGSVAVFAQQIRQRGPLDILIANAGIIMLTDTKRYETVDNFELHFQTNFLGHAALIQMLLPSLNQGSIGGRRAIVAVQSSLGAAVGRIHWTDLQLEHRYLPFKAYAQSKLALTLWALAQNHHASQGDLAEGFPYFAVVHPGVTPATNVAGPLRAILPPPLVRYAATHMGNPPRMAALPALMAVADSAPTGQMYAPSRWFQSQGPPECVPQFERARSPYAQERMAEVTQNLLLSSHALAEFL